MDFLEYIVEEGLVLIPALLIMGRIIKNAQYVPDKHIPAILLVGGIAGSIALLGVTVDAVIQGVLVTGAAVFTHNLIKQSQKEE